MGQNRAAGGPAGPGSGPPVAVVDGVLRVQGDGLGVELHGCCKVFHLHLVVPCRAENTRKQIRMRQILQNQPEPEPQPQPEPTISFQPLRLGFLLFCWRTRRCVVVGMGLGWELEDTEPSEPSGSSGLPPAAGTDLGRDRGEDLW